MSAPSAAGNTDLLGQTGNYISAAMVSLTGMPTLLYVAAGAAVVLMAGVGAYLFISSNKPVQPVAPQ